MSFLRAKSANRGARIAPFSRLGVIIPLYVMDDLLLMRNARLGFRNVVLRQAKVVSLALAFSRVGERQAL